MNLRLVNTTSAMLLASVLTLGCSKAENATDAVAAKGAGESAASHVHGEWWCSEHGVPEEICAQCKVELVSDFKAKGDWCEEHDRPDSQCFICHPEKEAEFAAQYEAKYGEKPPKLEESREGDDHDHEHGHDEDAKS